MTVEYEDPHTDAFLKISPVDVRDEASYKCEITYLDVRENCDVVQLIRLTTLVKPESVRILGVDGVSMGNASMLGPYDEGTQVELICEAIAGKPTPKVTWYNGTKPLKNRELYSSHEVGDGIGTGTSKLSFVMSRGDLGARFECRVDSEALDEPIVSWMTADVNVKPTKIELTGVKGFVAAGSNVMLMCDVHGARPSAEVKWFNISEPITDKKYIQTVPEKMRDGTFTTKSTLVFEASRFENGNAFHCYADNSVIRDQKEPSLHEVLLIEVYYAPVVTVSPSNITTNENVDILLLCSYVSNPMKLDGVVWAKNDRNITLNPDKYDGGTVDNPPLVIKNVSRDDMGEYTCMCKNGVGSQESEESVWLNVLYTPSVEISMDPPTPVKEKDQVNVTLLCSVTSGNPSTLTKVRWYLGGELMKELPDCNYTSYNEDGEGEGSGGQLCGIDPSLIGLWNVGQGMAGNYTCQGKNEAGWGPESDPAELIVYYPPGPARLTYTPSKVIKTASVTLDCAVSHPGRPENVSYLWYRGTYHVPEIVTSKWTISPVLLETKSNFTCIAVNEGGQSDPSTVFIDVIAPPSFIQNLHPYQGFLMNSKNISLTCRVECSPTCSISWFKDGRVIDGRNNPLYDIRNRPFPPDLRKNDFESIESTLVWNMSAWPNEMLDRTAPNSNYTCQSSPNTIGSGVNSTIEIAVDYPPENLTVSSKVVYVIEHHKPDKVTCSGKGHPNLNYAWRREGDSEYLPKKTDVLELGALTRQDSGNYICEASNKHGNESINVYINVRFSPSCTIEQVEYEGSHALECTARANPQEVTFSWKIKGENDSVEGSSLVQKGLKGYLLLDSSVDTYRTYQCFVNNSVGISVPCERDVTANQEQSSQIGIPGVAPWWRHFMSENLIILIAVIVGIIICVIIICIIIIIVCRRKRASNKYTNAVEMEEREKPDGQSPDTSGTKWPLKPGVLLHVNKMHNLNMSQLSPMSINAKQYKMTSVSAMRTRQHCRKNRLYSRLKRFKELLGFRDRDSLPFGVYRGSAGVVTFKKFKDASSPVQTERAAVSRKRKKPGLLPNQSSTADKGGLGAAQPGGGSADPLTDPDKGFYENLPFHGMQNPPNKPISIISPIIQGNPSYSSTKSLISGGTNFSPFNTVKQKKVQRNQSFHGFQTYGMYPNPFNQWPHFYPHMQFSHPNLQFIPSIFYNLPRSFSQHTGSSTVGAIRTNPQINPLNYYNRVQSFNSLQNPFGTFVVSNPFNQQTRVVGRSEHKLDIRRTASGINLPTIEKELKKSDKNKRYNSLEIKKHKCYSPTFYSMRCKKHAKKRPIIYTLPKRVKNEKTENTINGINEQYQDLTDSIQIFEQNAENSTVEDCTPKPAPRCSKHKNRELIYANVSKSIQSQLDNTQASNDSSENCDPEVSVIEAVVHKGDDKLPKVSEVSHKPIASLKVTPTVKVSPNFVKPKVESPKGALQTQLQAKIRAQKVNESNLILNSCTLVQKALSQTSLNQSNTSLDKLDVGDQMKKETTEKFNSSTPKTPDKLDTTNITQLDNQTNMFTPTSIANAPKTKLDGNSLDESKAKPDDSLKSRIDVKDADNSSVCTPKSTRSIFNFGATKLDFQTPKPFTPNRNLISNVKLKRFNPASIFGQAPSVFNNQENQKVFSTPPQASTVKPFNPSINASTSSPQAAIAKSLVEPASCPQSPIAESVVKPLNTPTESKVQPFNRSSIERCTKVITSGYSKNFKQSPIGGLKTQSNNPSSVGNSFNLGTKPFSANNQQAVNTGNDNQVISSDSKVKSITPASFGNNQQPLMFDSKGKPYSPSGTGHSYNIPQSLSDAKVKPLNPAGVAVTSNPFTSSAAAQNSKPDFIDNPASPKSAPSQKSLPKTITKALIPVVDEIKKPVAQIPKIQQDGQETEVPQMPLLDTQNKWNSINRANKQNSFYTLTTPHLKQLTGTNMHQQYSATIPHQKHMKLIPRSLFQDQQISKSKSFSSKSKPKKHFQIPLQKCHSFKFQTAESYFQPIKNIHEENFMRNGYISDLGPNYPENHPPRHHHKRDKQKTNGPLILRRPGDYHQENVQFQENVQNSVQLQYPQPVLGRSNMPRPNGIVYADLDMPKSNKKTTSKEGTASLTKSQKVKAKTEYATLQFNDVGQEIDV